MSNTSHLWWLFPSSLGGEVYGVFCYHGPCLVLETSQTPKGALYSIHSWYSSLISALLGCRFPLLPVCKVGFVIAKICLLSTSQAQFLMKTRYIEKGWPIYTCIYTEIYRNTWVPKCLYVHEQCHCTSKLQCQHLVSKGFSGVCTCATEWDGKRVNTSPWPSTGYSLEDLYSASLTFINRFLEESPWKVEWQ